MGRTLSFCGFAGRKFSFFDCHLEGMKLSLYGYKDDIFSINGLKTSFSGYEEDGIFGSKDGHFAGLKASFCGFKVVILWV